MLREDYIKKTGNDTLEKALADKNLRLIMKPAGSSVPPVARMVAGIARHQRRRLQEGRPADPGRCRADHQHAARRPRRPLLRERHQGPSGGHRGHADGRHALRRPAAEVARPAGEERPEAVADAGVLQGPDRARPRRSISAPSIIAHKSLPDDIAYLVTKTVVENKAELVKAHQAFGDFAPEDAWKPENNGIPLHPGAARYYARARLAQERDPVGRNRQRGGADSAHEPLRLTHWNCRNESFACVASAPGSARSGSSPRSTSSTTRRSRCWRGRCT